MKKPYRVKLPCYIEGPMKSYWVIGRRWPLRRAIKEARLFMQCIRIMVDGQGLKVLKCQFPFQKNNCTVFASFPPCMYSSWVITLNIPNLSDLKSQVRSSLVVTLMGDPLENIKLGKNLTWNWELLSVRVGSTGLKSTSDVTQYKAVICAASLSS